MVTLVVTGALVATPSGPGRVPVAVRGAPAELADTGPPATRLASGSPSPARRTRVPFDREPAAPVPVGHPSHPFAPVPGLGPVGPADARVVVTPTGLALPVVDHGPGGWLVTTACQSVARVAAGTPIGRAHVVLDPGHGGAEPGAVGPGGLVEKDLNLTVAREAARLLTEAGATVVLTRDGDHTMTAAARGLVARAVAPALLVSIHHNGGAPPGDGGPGTIVFTRTASPESTRFGGLFHETLTPVLDRVAAEARERHRRWGEAMDAHDRALEAHHDSVAARDRALVANGQVPPEATTTVPPPTIVADGQARVPRAAAVATTTTVPATGPTTVPVPGTVPPPVPPVGEPVPPFRWAGSGNAGVRSWTRADGLDHLAVLRASGRAPAALAEFVYLTNPSEEALLADRVFLDAEAAALAEAVVRYLTGAGGGTGFVADQHGDQPIGGGGRIEDCVEPPLE
jgi:N-acetylmuramoyl-L-alanine amidase